MQLEPRQQQLLQHCTICPITSVDKDEGETANPNLVHQRRDGSKTVEETDVGGIGMVPGVPIRVPLGKHSPLFPVKKYLLAKLRQAYLHTLRQLRATKCFERNFHHRCAD